jgi:hypothetical protein
MKPKSLHVIKRPLRGLICFLTVFFWVGLSPVLPSTELAEDSEALLLHKAKVYVMAGDYRRAVESCQRYLDAHPSVEGYVYLAYVYETIEGYLKALTKKDDWVKVHHLSLNLTSREMLDLIDPPDVLPRMAREVIGEGIRQQFDVTASMANRLDRARTEELWAQQSAWRKAQPEMWWAGVPAEWGW